MLSEKEVLEFIDKAQKIREHLEIKCCDDPLCAKRLLGAILSEKIGPLVKAWKAVVNTSDSAECLEYLDETLARIAEQEAKEAAEAANPDAVAGS